jgi:hypothetical protein
MGSSMVRGTELFFRSRRFVVDLVTAMAALLLAVAAYTATIDPYLLVVLATLIGVALMVEPRSSRPPSRPFAADTAELKAVSG